MTEKPHSIYLDNAATSATGEAVLQAMWPYFHEEYANPSAVHSPGVRAKRALEAAREQVQAACSSRPGQVIFTSGGTEANNLAILGFGRSRKGDGILCSAVEHPSAGRAATEAADRAGIPCRQVRVDREGRLDLDHLEDSLSPKTSVVALIHGQNEVGTLQPIAEASRIVRSRAPRALIHVDAVQSFGKVSLEEVTAVADSVALSAHKIRGPKGAGALVLFTRARPAPLLLGGGQEDSLRSGTENVAGCVGFGVAAATAVRDIASVGTRLAGYAERIRSTLERIPAVRVLGGSPRLPTITAATIDGVRGEILQHHLEQAGFIIGTGSACHAAKNRISATYEALGLTAEEARSVIRVSLGSATSEDDVDRFVSHLPAAVEEVRELIR